MLYLFRISLPKISIAILFVLLVVTASAQNEIKKEYQSNLEDWTFGSVQINEKTVIEGWVRYNWMENILSVKTKEGTRTFNAQSIQRFNMHDASEIRHFISSPNQKTTDENPTCYFFEILKECKHFALMMQERAYAYKEVSTNYRYMSSTTTRMVVVEKTFYFFDEDGNIKPYMIMTEKNALGFPSFYSRAKKKKKVLDKKLMATYLGDRYEELKAYAKKNDLSFRDEKDLVTILTYFKKQESI